MGEYRWNGQGMGVREGGRFRTTTTTQSDSFFRLE